MYVVCYWFNKFSAVGLVYTWGTGTFGQTGVDEDKVKNCPEFKIDVPTLIETLVDVVQVACGEESMAAVTSMHIRNNLTFRIWKIVYMGKGILWYKILHELIT